MPKKTLLQLRGSEVACTKGHNYFLLGKGGGFFPHCVPNVPQHVPNSSSLYLIFCALSSPLENILYIHPKEESKAWIFFGVMGLQIRDGLADLAPSGQSTTVIN
jgi:hypothetical protein